MSQQNKCEQIYRALKQRAEISSQNSISRMIPGVSPATVSLIVTRKWENISDRMWNRIAAYLKIDNWQLIETANFLTIQELCCDAQNDCRFLAVAANSGLGKTEGLNNYVKKNPNVFYLMADVLMSGKVHFLTALQRAMGLEEGRNAPDMLLAITHRLNELENPLLIIDDAGKLTDGNLRLVQLIYDHTVRRCGIIIAGTEFLRVNLERGRRLNRMGYEELYRRIELWQKLNTPTAAEIKTLAEMNGLNNTKVVGAIIRSDTNFGNVRASIENAIKLAQKNNLTVETFANQSNALN